MTWHCDLDDGCEPPIVATKHPGTVAKLHSDHVGLHMSRCALVYAAYGQSHEYDEVRCA